MGNKSYLRKILWGLAIAVITSPIVLLFNHLGMPEFARPAYFVLMVILVVIKVCWELHSRTWFWITIIAIAALHVPLVVFTVRWLFQTPFSVMFVFAIVDFALFLAIIDLVERVIDSKDAHNFQKNPE